MLTPELRTYLEKIEAMATVPADGAIKDALFSAGWNDESIRDALSYVSVIKQKKTGDARAATVVQSLPVVHDVSFVGEDEGQPRAPAGQAQVQVPPQPTMSASTGAFNGKSSQSVLYPDNSSRLGLRGGVPPSVLSQKTDTPVSSVRSDEQPSAFVMQKGPPLADIVESLPTGMDTAVSDIQESIRDQRQEIPPVKDVSRIPVSTGGTPVLASKVSMNPTAPPPRVQTPLSRPIDGVRPLQTPAPFTVSVPQTQVTEIPSNRPVQIPAPRVIAHRSNRFVKRVGIIAVLLGVLAAVGYAYVAGIGPFALVEGPYKDTSFASDFLAGMSRMKSGIATAQYQAGYVPPVAGDELLPVASSTSVPLLPFLPSERTLPDTAVSLSVSTTFDRTQQKTNDFQFSIDGSYVAGGATIAGAIEALRVDNAVYARFSKVPVSPIIAMFLGDIRTLEGKWISLNASTTGESSVEQYVLRASAWSATTTSLAGSLLRTLAEALDSERVIVVSSKERTPSWKGDATRYHLSISFEKMAPALRRVLNHVLTTRQDVPDSYATQLRDAIAKLESTEYASLLAYMTKHMKLTVDVADDGIPLAVTQTVQVLVPKAQNNSNQMSFQSRLSFSFADTNKPIELRAPEDALTLPDVSRLLMNLEEDEYQVSLQLTRVSALAQAIETFQQVVGRLPKTLDELAVSASTTLPQGIAKSASPSVSFLWEQYKDRPFLPNVPVDVFTKKPFTYSVSSKGAGYTLVYTVTLPKELRTEALERYSDWSYELGGADGKVPKWRVVSGKNTLTETHFSVEGKIRRK